MEYKNEELKKERAERGQREMDFLRSKFWRDKQIQERKDFDRLDATESILDLKYQTDNCMLMELFLDWSKKARNDEQKKLINESFIALARMQSYVSTLQTVSKSAVSRLLESRTTNKKISKENEDLKKEIKALKAEIEHYENE